MPGQTQSSFSLTSAYVPTGDRNNLSAFVAVNADPGPDYGQLRVLQLPRSVQINGPSLRCKTPSSPTTSWLNSWNLLRRGTTVEAGQPVDPASRWRSALRLSWFLQAQDSTSFPLLRARSFVPSATRWHSRTRAAAVSRQVVLGRLRCAMTGGAQHRRTPPPTGGGATGNAALASALADAQKALADSKAALAAGGLHGLRSGPATRGGAAR